VKKRLFDFALYVKPDSGLSNKKQQYVSLQIGGSCAGKGTEI
jgi:hypothetical protein